jgi:putative inorganic carbon (HCO3(-)) transporter
VILEALGAILAAALVAAAILLREPRSRAWCALGALVLAPVLLIADIWDSSQLAPLRDRPLVSVLAGLVGVAAVVGAASFVRRRPLLLPLAVVAAVPFRVPIESGGDTSNLLVPLYVVIAIGIVAFAWDALRGPVETGIPDAPGERPPERRKPGLLEQFLAASVVLYALQATWSGDFSKGLDNLVFFYVPFALLFVLVSRVQWSVMLAVRCLAVLVALGLVFAGIGFFEFATKHLVLSSNALDANSYQSYFRVSSLFFDPNIYGRFLAVVLVMVTAVLLWTRSSSRVLVCGAIVAVLLAGIVLSLSESSLGALLAGLTVLAALRWGFKPVAFIVGGLLVVGVAAVIALPGASGVEIGSGKLNKTSSGRVDLVEGGLELWRDRPLWGYGSGSFEEQFRDQKKSNRTRAANASHTIPVTIAAEQGLIGLLVYLGLLLAAFGRLFKDAFTSPVRAAVAAAFTTVVVHTFLYAAFLEDPLTWVLLAAGAALAWQLQPSPRERALAREERRAARAAVSATEQPEPAVSS